MDPARLRGAFKECMKNHAATLGTYASDGCGEYIPDLDARYGPLSSHLLCGACGCHRNFHRRETSENTRPVGGDGGHRQGQWDMPAIIDDDGPDSQRGRQDSVRRRQRTKFSSSQKAQMANFAERIGWKIPKVAGAGDGSDDEVSRFCREIGVTRQVFRVWMHNHKSSPAQMVSSSSISDATAATTGAVVAEGENGAAGDDCADAVTAACAGFVDSMEAQ